MIITIVSISSIHNVAIVLTVVIMKVELLIMMGALSGVRVPAFLRSKDVQSKFSWI